MVMTKEHKEKIAYALKEHYKKHERTKEHRAALSRAAKINLAIPENNPNYKGDKIGYIGIHTWLKKKFGSISACEICGIKGKKFKGQWTISWALKRGLKYERKRENFWGLCDICHRRHDKTEIWNKNISLGKKGRTRAKMNLYPIRLTKEGEKQYPFFIGRNATGRLKKRNSIVHWVSESSWTVLLEGETKYKYSPDICWEYITF